MIHEAFHIANTGRKGPVLIDIPKDVSANKIVFKPALEKVNIRGYNPTTDPNKKQVEKIIAAIEKAERPVILAGGAIVYADASAELLEFVNKTQIPITTTLLGLGGFPTELWMGMPGMHGTYTANMAIQNADLLISIGARFDDRVTMKLEGFAPKAKIAHIDVDPAEIGKNRHADVPIVGDVKAVITDLIEALRRERHRSGVDRTSTTGGSTCAACRRPTR